MKRERYDQSEVEQAAVEYFHGDEVAAKEWITKYALKDSEGNIYELTPDDTHRRIASEIARIEQNYPNSLAEDDIFDLFRNFRYIVPQSRSMINIGNDAHISPLANSFIIEKKSDYFNSVSQIDEEQDLLIRRDCNVSHDLSQILPKDSTIKNSDLISGGVIPFVKRYTSFSHKDTQCKNKHLSLSLSISHPDSKAFINTASCPSQNRASNISLRIHDDFMQLLLANESKYTQQYPVGNATPLINKESNATELWEHIISYSCKYSNPKILFWDTILNESISDCYADLGFKTISATPQGNTPLGAYDGCRLLAINLYSYVNRPFTKEASFDFDLFKKHIQYAQRILDDVVDLDIEKIETIIENIKSSTKDDTVKAVEYELWQKIKEKTRQGRRIGLGITAEADMLAALGLHYDTDAAIDFAEKVHKTLAFATYRASINIAKERGAFALYDAKREKENPFIKRLRETDAELYENMIKFGRRNITCLTTISNSSMGIITQTTRGINSMTVSKENNFDINSLIHHKFRNWMDTNNFSTNKKYTTEELEGLFYQSPYHRTVPKEESLLKAVQMQGRIQRWTDLSVCTTLQLPADTTEELISKLYKEAWQCGCKGLFIQKEGTGQTEEIYFSEERNDEKSKNSETYKEVLSRPTELDCDVVRFQNNKDKWIAFVGLKDGRPYEIFTGIADDEEGISLPKNVVSGKIIKVVDNKGKRYDFQFTNKRGFKTTVEGLSHKFDKEYWNYAKLISGVLRYGMPIDQVIKLISSLQLDNESINTWKVGVERALKKYLSEDNSEPNLS